MLVKYILLVAVMLTGSVLASSPGIVISQVYGGGGNTGSTLRNDFIELLNRGTETIDVTGWSVQYTSASGTTWELTRLSGAIRPGRYFLIQEAQGAGGTVNLPAPDVLGIIAIGSTAGKIALVARDLALNGACPNSSEVVDWVGYGTAGCAEGSAAPALTNTTALFRTGGGCIDSDNNAADFTVGAPAPRNSASPEANCSTSGSSSSTTTTTSIIATSTTTSTPATTTTILPTAQLVFPHIADGGGYRTTLLITNSSSTAANAAVHLFTPEGTPLNVKAGNVAGSVFQLILPAGGSAKMSTDGSAAAVSTGWAKVIAAAGAQLNGNAVFQFFAENALVSEASVPAAMPTSVADFYADESPGIHTGFAMANPGTIPSRGTITLRNESGKIVGSAEVQLAPGSQQARFLFELFSGASSGRAEVRLSEGALALVALRFHNASIFSTLSIGVPGASWTAAEALFSPQGGVRARLVTEIDRASKSIDLAIYTFTSFALRDALIRARNRGVPIRIITDTSQLTDPYSQIPTLENLLFTIKKLSGTPSGLMHNKYMIIDGMLLFTGSYNWSNSAEEYNFENALFLQGSPAIEAYIADFNRLWGR